MPGVLLDRTASVWRMTNNPTGRPAQTSAQVYASIRCAIVPITSFSSEPLYARESTHVIWVPHWLRLLIEDEVRWGRRTSVARANVQAEVYVINGARRFTQAVSELAFYAREKF